MQVTTNQIYLAKCRLRLARPLRKAEATAIRGFFGRKFDDEIFMHNHEPDGTPVYHTYLGSAYCLTFPQWVEITRGESPDIEDSKLDCASIVPTDAIKQLLFDDGLRYSRASGMLSEHIGLRRFRGTVNVIYEANGKQIAFVPTKPTDAYWEFVRLENKEIVCLW